MPPSRIILAKAPLAIGSSDAFHCMFLAAAAVDKAAAVLLFVLKLIQFVTLLQQLTPICSDLRQEALRWRRS